ncbi:MAG TPA: hypothetical protein VGM84_09855 [Steroidobacteraceae bacterium]
MNLNELFFVVVGGLLGWWIVSWIISLFRQQKRPPVDIVDGGQRKPWDRANPPNASQERPALPPPLDLTRDDPPVATPGTGAGPGEAPGPAGAWGDRASVRSLSVTEISAQWASILGVAESASAAEVEAAYHDRLAECDRIRFAATASDAHKDEAQERRARVTQAYEFVRPLKD